MTTKRYSQQELEDFYKGSYVEKLSKQPLSRLQRLLPYIELKKTDIVADFGCGDGLLMSLIHDKVNQYYGVDFSEEFISAALARSKNMGINNGVFQCADIIEFCRKNVNTFDKAFTMDFSEHIYDDMFFAMYKGIYDSLKVNGKLYLHTPNGGYILEILKDRGILKQFPQHVAVRRAEEYKSLLQSLGFGQIRVYNLAHYVTPLSQMHFLSYIPVFGRFFQARLLIECCKVS